MAPEKLSFDWELLSCQSKSPKHPSRSESSSDSSLSSVFSSSTLLEELGNSRLMFEDVRELAILSISDFTSSDFVL